MICCNASLFYKTWFWWQQFIIGSFHSRIQSTIFTTWKWFFLTSMSDPILLSCPIPGQTRFNIASFFYSAHPVSCLRSKAHFFGWHLNPNWLLRGFSIWYAPQFMAFHVIFMVCFDAVTGCVLCTNGNGNLHCSLSGTIDQVVWQPFSVIDIGGEVIPFLWGTILSPSISFHAIN